MGVTPIFLFLSSNSLLLAKDILSVVCEEPKGLRVQLINSKFDFSEDGMKSSKPTFIIDYSNPDTALMKFESTSLMNNEQMKALGKEKHNSFEKILIVHNDGNRIILLQSYRNEIWMYTLFPKKNVGYFSRQGFLGDKEPFLIPISVNFYTKCDFK